MNVSNLKKVYFFLLLLFLLGCNKKEKENIETYQILNLILNEYSFDNKNIDIKKKFPVVGFKNSNHIISIKDSLNIFKKNYKEMNRKKIIAIKPLMFGISKNYFFNNECNVFKEFSDSFYQLKSNKPIELNKINLYGKDSLVYYEDFYNKQLSKGYDKLDVCFNFSRIKFNNNYDKAILIVGISFSKLDGVSTLYLLEKNNLKWQIKCIKGLSIS